MVSLVYAALCLLNGGKTKIRPQSVHVDARIPGQRTGGGLVDVEHVPIVVTTSTHIGDLERRFERELLLQRHVPVPSVRRLQMTSHRSKGNGRFYRSGQRGARVVDRDVINRDCRLERRIPAGE